MGRLSKILKSSAWLLLCGGLAVQSANAQSARYPADDEPWDGTSYRALVERFETQGLPLPTLSNTTTRPVFERMVSADNIPLRVGLNRDLSTTIRYQKLDGARLPIHALVTHYATEAQKGKPYATELARLRVYEAKVSAALLDLSEPFLATFTKDRRYQARVTDLDQMKSGARQLYSDLVQAIAETRLYSKSDVLVMIEGALDGLPSYQPTFTDQDRRDLVQKLAERISATADQQLKTALTQLRDAIEHRQIRI